mmetsp:Transcript_46250/g.112091  ORF Transcript_46250/g.112091 Transcript_46250/m.112091 type:complete len:128 (-) Transcript_46250:102-485(-)
MHEAKQGAGDSMYQRMGGFQELPFQGVCLIELGGSFDCVVVLSYGSDFVGTKRRLDVISLKDYQQDIGSHKSSSSSSSMQILDPLVIVTLKKSLWMPVQSKRVVIGLEGGSTDCILRQKAVQLDHFH